MKKSKILMIALSLALLVCAAVGISVSAESSEQVYDILAMNISYGDTTQVVLAVDTEIENAKNTVVTYTYGGETYTAKYFEGYTYTENSVEYPTFYTKGISAKDIGENISAEAHHKDAVDFTPAYENVCVAEYLYGKLYRDGAIEAKTEIGIHKKELYEALLVYGAKAQTSLWNDVNDTKRVLVTDRIYVYAQDADINGAGYELLLDSAASVTLTYTGTESIVGWNVTTYTNGVGETVTVTENTFEITTHTVIKPALAGDVKDPYVIDFNDATVGTGYNPKEVHSQLLNWGTGTIDVVEQTEGDLAINPGSSSMWFYPADATPDGKTANATVFQFTVNYTDSTVKNDYFYWRYSGSSTNLTTTSIVSNTIRVVKADGTNTGWVNLVDENGSRTKDGQDIVIRFEYLWSGKLNVYSNGVLIIENADVAPFDAAFDRVGLESKGNVRTFDDVKCINTYIE